ncbi:hypothetical protein RD1_3189 [Roseobacter denitrificans OCh 114]|uniref:Uncharacterized protein n=1 Tax=Roseobacter denitrificans (strain ATCC 33942 / OCh 114) TaxID=375451 RepID=Q163Z9_ROSDO|nr:hypothetical protein RD1_3189 [Roseobacter denitrificans OCh 114]
MIAVFRVTRQSVARTLGRPHANARDESSDFGWYWVLLGLCEIP